MVIRYFLFLMLMLADGANADNWGGEQPVSSSRNRDKILEMQELILGRMPVDESKNRKVPSSADLWRIDRAVDIGLYNSGLRSALTVNKYNTSDLVADRFEAVEVLISQMQKAKDALKDPSTSPKEKADAESIIKFGRIFLISISNADATDAVSNKIVSKDAYVDVCGVRITEEQLARDTVRRIEILGPKILRAKESARDTFAAIESRRNVLVRRLNGKDALLQAIIDIKQVERNDALQLMERIYMASELRRDEKALEQAIEDIKICDPGRKSKTKNCFKKCF